MSTTYHVIPVYQLSIASSIFNKIHGVLRGHIYLVEPKYQFSQQQNRSKVVLRGYPQLTEVGVVAKPKG